MRIISPRLAAIGVGLAGVAAAVHYARAGLTLSHYDARAHLVVARRLIDSLTPGWEQIGAVWLPLPHLLNALPVQIDALYRTGYSGVALSIASLALAAYAASSLIVRVTGSVAGALAGAALFVLNPNVLYLQSTPMTEPLLIGFVVLALERLARWAETRTLRAARHAGMALAAACWTRYEAWPIAAAALVLAGLAAWRLAAPPVEAARGVLRIARWPAAAIALFFPLSRMTTGAWFVSGGFFVPDNPALGHPLVAARQIADGATTLGGGALVLAGLAGGMGVVTAAIVRRERAAPLLCLAPIASALLPWYAFLQGHPFRVRYMVMMVTACALLAGTGLALIRGRAQSVLAVLLVVSVCAARPPFDSRAAMVLEAQWDVPFSRAREAVTAYFRAAWDGQPIMASMASLAHYMQETARAGFDIRDFLHEGNGDLWKDALKTPFPHAAWMLIEERAEGGDLLAARARSDPAFLRGYRRVAEGGGLALYRRR